MRPISALVRFCFLLGDRLGHVAWEEPPSSASRLAEEADGGLMPPRLAIFPQKGEGLVLVKAS